MQALLTNLIEINFLSQFLVSIFFNAFMTITIITSRTCVSLWEYGLAEVTAVHQSIQQIIIINNLISDRLSEKRFAVIYCLSMKKHLEAPVSLKDCANCIYQIITLRKFPWKLLQLQNYMLQYFHLRNRPSRLFHVFIFNYSNLILRATYTYKLIVKIHTIF